MHDSLFVFDIETVPDTDAVPALVDGDVPEDVEGRRAALEQYHLDVTNGNNSFPRQPFHKVVAISFLEAEIDKDGRHETYSLKELRSGGNEDASEEEILKGFFNYLSKRKPRFVTYNGRNFDMPVLKFRAMKYGISAPWLYQSGDKWNNYFSRYSADWHCDLLDVLKDYGAMSGGLKMNEVCAILNLPGKIGVDGSKVSGMYDKGEIAGIRHYCETDVLNTYLVYLHWQRHTGTLSENGFEDAVAQVRDYLAEEGKARAYLKEFEEAWAASESI